MARITKSKNVGSSKVRMPWKIVSGIAKSENIVCKFLNHEGDEKLYVRR